MASTRSIVSKSAILFQARIAGSGIAFLTQLIVARVWGAETLGEILLLLACTNIIAAILPLGLNSTGAYFAAEYLSKNQESDLRRFACSSFFLISITSTICFIGAYLLVPSDLLGFSKTIQWICALAVSSAPAISVISLGGAILVGLRYPIFGLFPEMLLRPIAVILPILLMYWWGVTSNVLDGMWGVVVGYWLIAALMICFVYYSLPKSNKPVKAGEPARWMRFAAPWFAIAFINDFIFDIDLILLSGLLSKEELGVFGVALRFLALFGFALSAIYSVMLPEMFSSDEKPEKGIASAELGRANILAAATGTSLFLMILLLGDFLLSFFGPRFVEGATVLSILMVCLVVRSMFGPASLVLSMFGRPNVSLSILFAGVGLLIALNSLLTPAFGIVGAAVALSVTISFWSIGLWLLTWYLTGENISVFAAFSKRGKDQTITSAVRSSHQETA